MKPEEVPLMSRLKESLSEKEFPYYESSVMTSEEQFACMFKNQLFLSIRLSLGLFFTR
jgi:hypothetical protein